MCSLGDTQPKRMDTLDCGRTLQLPAVHKSLGLSATVHLRLRRCTFFLTFPLSHFPPGVPTVWEPVGLARPRSQQPHPTLHPQRHPGPCGDRRANQGCTKPTVHADMTLNFAFTDEAVCVCVCVCVCVRYVIKADTSVGPSHFPGIENETHDMRSQVALLQVSGLNKALHLGCPDA